MIAGFEPTRAMPNRFQIDHLKPLGHIINGTGRIRTCACIAQ